MTSVPFNTWFGLGLLDRKALVRPLTTSDLDQCIVVESAFPPAERGSRPAFTYRLSKFPELCLGLFIESSGDTQNPLLIAHVIATREATRFVTEESMSVPSDWNVDNNVRDRASGDQHTSDVSAASVAVHSLAVSPDYQRKGLGPWLMRAYHTWLSRNVSYADRVIIIAHDWLIKFYTALGFQKDGPSACTFAGGGWYDMTLDLKATGQQSMPPV